MIVRLAALKIFVGREMHIHSFLELEDNKLLRIVSLIHEMPDTIMFQGVLVVSNKSLNGNLPNTLTDFLKRIEPIKLNLPVIVFQLFPIDLAALQFNVNTKLKRIVGG